MPAKKQSKRRVPAPAGRRVSNREIDQNHKALTALRIQILAMQDALISLDAIVGEMLSRNSKARGK